MAKLQSMRKVKAMCCRCSLLFILVAIVPMGAKAQGPDQIEFTSYTLVGEGLDLNWDGGNAPYQVQSSTSLPGVWSAETSEVPDKSDSILAGLDAERRFFRVVSGDSILPPANAIVLPAPGATLMAPLVNGERNKDVTFTWEAGGIEPARWWLYVGIESDNDLDKQLYFNSDGISSERRQFTVTGIPFDGEDVLVTLWWRTEAGNWIERSYTYETIDTRAEITSHDLGDRLQNAGAFQMAANGLNVNVWFVYVGSTVGGSEYSAKGRYAASTSSVPYEGVPSDNSTVYVRLFWLLVGSTTYESRDYEFLAPNGPS